MASTTNAPMLGKSPHIEPPCCCDYTTKQSRRSRWQRNARKKEKRSARRSEKRQWQQIEWTAE